MYKGLMKKAVLVSKSGEGRGNDNSTPPKKFPPSHAFEVSPPKKSKSKVTVSMHVVTIGDDSEIICGPPGNIAPCESNDARDRSSLLIMNLITICTLIRRLLDKGRHTKHPALYQMTKNHAVETKL